MKATKETMALRSRSLSPSGHWEKKKKQRMALLLPAPAAKDVLAASEAASKKVAEPRQEKAMIVHLSKPEPEVSPAVTLDWPEGRRWEETPIPSD